MRNILLILSVVLSLVAAGQDAKQGVAKEEILRTNPYLQNPTNAGITVSWQTNVPCYSWVEYGLDTAHMQRAHTLIAGQVISNNKLNKIRINDLEKGKKYYYRVHSREIVEFKPYKKVFGEEYVSPLYSFSLPTDGKEEFTALVFNDLHQKRELMDALIKVVRERGVEYDFVVFNGDCIDDPNTEAQAIESISYFNDRVGASSKPVIYIRGNHEIRGAFSMDFTTLFDYAGGKSYGAFSWGDTRIVMLDCGEDKPDDHWVYYGLNDFNNFRREQVEFLNSEHASAAFKKAAKRILIHHIPLWYSPQAAENETDKYQPCTELWGDLIADEPYNLILNAHTHRFASFKKGAIPVVIGGGNTMNSASVMVLTNKSLKCYNTNGEQILNLEI